jgi:putative DNA primase/helicase
MQRRFFAVATLAPQADGKVDKAPRNPLTLKLAETNDVETLGTYAETMQAIRTGRAAVCGPVLKRDGVICIDLDRAINPETGELSTGAQFVLSHFPGAMVTISASGYGLHIWIKAKPRFSGACENLKHDGQTVEILAEKFVIERWQPFGEIGEIKSFQVELEALLSAIKPKREPAPVSPITHNGTTKNGTGGAYVRAALLGKLNDSRAKMEAAQDGEKHGVRFDLARLLGGFVHYGHFNESDIENALGVNFGPSEANARKTIRDGIRDGVASPLNIEVPTPKVTTSSTRFAAQETESSNGDSESATVQLGYALTDTGNAERYISQHGENFLHSKALGFHTWNAQCWAPDETDQVFEWGKKTVRRIYQEAAHADDDARPKIAKWAHASESLPRRNAMIEIAAKDGPKVLPEDFDRDQFLFNVQNGTLDLRTGILLRHDRAALITKCAPVKYDPKATCPRFIQFLAAILNGDEETAIFLQRFFGYTLTGSTREQCFLILYGDGSNGKSTLLNVLRWLLGTYCKQTKPDTLMQKKFGDGIPNDVAMLRGARMVTAIETNEGRQFDEAKIKEMTGGDPVSARFFRKEFFEFVPEFKLYLATNHKPRIIGDDAGIWRRVRLVPFNVSFWNPDKQGETGPEHLRADKTLGDALREELPGILNWALQGCLDWQRDGLPEPRSVADATEEYRAESDPLETFLAERCYRAEHCTTPNAILFEEFSKWAEREDENELSQKVFTARMKLKGFENSRGTGGLRRWKGVGLLSMGGH